MMQWLDRHPNVLTWASESDIIPYFDPAQQKHRRYYIDFRAVFATISGGQQTVYIEVKPYRETIAPVQTKRKQQKTYAHEFTTWITNNAKWKAATQWARAKGGVFKIVTEKELFKNM
jgi:hypothetical protein